MKNYLFLLGACIMLGSCSTGEAAISAGMLGRSSQALVFLGGRAVSEEEVEFEFSRPVIIRNLSFNPDISVVSVEDGGIVRVRLEENLEPGMLITADLLAEDENRNTINVLVTLRSRNNRMPDLVINELCTEYVNNDGKRRAEFIEFKVKSDGNLGAMRVFIAGNSNAARQTIYEFSPVEVRRGDYIVLHLRTYDPASRNEYGNDLAQSGGLNSSPNARDFWIPGTTKLLHKTSFVYVLDQDDRVLSAVMLCENPNAPWPKDYFFDTAAFLFEQGAWQSEDGISCRPSDAVRTSGTTNTRTICRDETLGKNSNSSADWYITATSGATPGTVNDPRRHSN